VSEFRPTSRTAAAALSRQFSAFAGVGVAAAVVHYGLLVGLVELLDVHAVWATLAGYVAGGVVSYGLNRRYAFRSDRPHGEATWRFALVAGVGFGLTGLSMALLHGRAGAPYLLAQLATTGLVMVWSFAANRWWTFRGRSEVPPAPP
jgi:putative flippase GtrA